LAVGVIATLQKELASKQLTWKEANWDAETCTKAVIELKEMVDRPLVQVTLLETQIGVLSGTIMDHSTKLIAKELCLERTTMAKDDLMR
jgi:hypothetical protein